ncbi:MAG: SDR family NAD(P)-dependent oxidoreductase [Alphaproteobacteria bacterium]|nr:SDR family NAD(P)-dependent oxidoreductase [Alphaproteobacteria bacterium]
MPTILVTGANRGLGLEFVRQFGADGWRVHACCRDPQQAAELGRMARSLPDVRVHRLSVSDGTSVADLAADLAGEPIDILLNNAGTYGLRGFAEGGMADQSFGSMDYAAWEHAFAVNTMAPLRMMEALVDNVAASAQKKMFVISSSMGSIGQPPGGHLAYGSTKAAVNFVASTLAQDLRSRGITVMSLHPGWVQTDMGGSMASLKPTQSVAGLKQVMEAASLATSGRFVDYNGRQVAW